VLPQNKKKPGTARKSHPRFVFTLRYARIKDTKNEDQDFKREQQLPFRLFRHDPPYNAAAHCAVTARATIFELHVSLTHEPPDQSLRRLR
jgi:hypothetical protein